MKKIKILALLLAAVLLQGCTAGQTEDTLPVGWSADWERVGPLLGVEAVTGFTLDEKNDALSVNGIYYATWTAGEGRQHTNEDGEDATVFDAQIYVLLKECRSEDAAKTERGIWIAREKQSYTAGTEESAVFAGQEFEVLPLLGADDKNPYTHGVAAFGTRGEWAICVELLCGEGYHEDPQAVIQMFLSGLYYSK